MRASARVAASQHARHGGSPQETLAAVHRRAHAHHRGHHREGDGAMSILTRDQWLNGFIAAARPVFAKAGSPLPEKVRAAICPPHRSKQRYIGLCWSDAVSEDNGREIWITAALTDPVKVAGILVHELCHAALPHDVKHGKP